MCIILFKGKIDFEASNVKYVGDAKVSIFCSEKNEVNIKLPNGEIYEFSLQHARINQGDAIIIHGYSNNPDVGHFYLKISCFN